MEGLDDFLECEFDQRTELLLSTWLRPIQSHEFHAGAEYLLSLLKARKAKSFLCDSRYRDPLSVAGRAWFKNVYVARMKQTALTRVALVTSIDLLLDSELELLVSYLNLALENQVKHQKFETEESALEWLLQPKQQAC